MTLDRRLTDLESRRPDEPPRAIHLHLSWPVAEEAGGGKKVEVKRLPAGLFDPPAFYYYKESEEAEREELTKEEYDALPQARHTLPESDPRHKPRHEQ